ncbi:MAG: UDP-glucose 4-epimerase GalE [Saprospiraceae bacterium]
MAKILVTGGCGYIGSHTLVDLIHQGFAVVSVDNLCNARADSLLGVAAITGQQVPNYATDLCDLEALRLVFREHPDISGVIHFAALKSVGESVGQPLRYYRNNLQGLLNLVQVMEEAGVGNLIFSSSCSVYGNTDALPVTEETPRQEAESPYARTKQVGEDILQDYARVKASANVVLLRYFNPAGAHESALIGEDPSNPANNLVPVIVETAAGKRQELVVFGADYPTRDGSNIRDYIHVMDLANAHTKAMEYLLAGRNPTRCEIFNLGIGQGVSVLEAIRAFEETTEKKLNYRIGPRRPGDVVAIYANFDKAAQYLGWKPKRDIADIMRSAWAWEKKKDLPR